MNDFEDNSLGGGATYSGDEQDSLSEKSLGDEGTLGDFVSDQQAVIDDGEVIDLESRYKVESTLGRGGMGEVLLAVDTRLDRKVAIKRILGEAARSKTAIDRFLTEAKSIAAIGDHPNIVQIYDYGRAKDGPFLIMEYVDGINLQDRCRDGALPLEEAVDLTCQLCDGLSRAHDQGIVHRDIKPANVLLTKDGVPKLTDFGLAKADVSNHQMTVTGAVLGTPDFMPPEQRRDVAEVDARSDLWSLAATLYQMVTGRSPKIIRFRDVPDELEDILGKALEESKDDRFQTIKEFRDALKTSLTKKVEPVTVDFGEGQCPSCGVKNESSRKFCRGCGDSLEATCLSCDKPMFMWDEICGECGSRQTPLIEQRRGELSAKQAEAESLLKEHRFDEAEALAVGLKEESDPRLKQLVPWATEFLPVIAEAYEAERTRAASLFQDAQKHEASYDYHSALDTLAMIPKPLQKMLLPGCSEAAAEAIDRVSAIQSEVKNLEQLVNNRVKQRQLNGLIPDVERLSTLCPKRKDVETLLMKLRDRAAKLLKQRDDAVQLAGKYLEDKDYEAAIAVLRKIDKSLVSNDVKRIRLQAEKEQGRLGVLMAQIKQARQHKAYDQLLIESVEEAISLSKDSSGLEPFLAKLKEYDEQLTDTIKGLIENGKDAMRACNWRRASEIFSQIPIKRRTEEVSSGIELVEKLMFSLSVFQDAVSKFLTSDFLLVNTDILSTALQHGKAYCGLADFHGFVDNRAIRTCEKIEDAIRQRGAAAEAKARASKNIRIAVMVTGLVVTLVALITGLSYAYQVAHRIASEVAKKQGIAVEIEAKLAATPPDVNGAFDLIDWGENNGVKPDLVFQLKSKAYAKRAICRAAEGLLEEALEDLTLAKSLDYRIVPEADSIQKKIYEVIPSAIEYKLIATPPDFRGAFELLDWGERHGCSVDLISQLEVQIYKEIPSGVNLKLAATPPDFSGAFELIDWGERHGFTAALGARLKSQVHAQRAVYCEAEGVLDEALDEIAIAASLDSSIAPKVEESQERIYLKFLNQMILSVGVRNKDLHALALAVKKFTQKIDFDKNDYSFRNEVYSVLRNSLEDEGVDKDINDMRRELAMIIAKEFGLSDQRTEVLSGKSYDRPPLSGRRPFDVKEKPSVATGLSPEMRQTLSPESNEIKPLALGIESSNIPLPTLPDGAGPTDATAPGSFTKTATGLEYRILRTGSGEKPTAADTVSVHYHGWLDNGTVFDSSYKRGQSIEFPLSGVIPGWTEGMQLVAQGGMIELQIPSAIGYGAHGAPPVIPPNATLHFVVELLDVK